MQFSQSEALNRTDLSEACVTTEQVLGLSNPVLTSSPYITERGKGIPAAATVHLASYACKGH